MEQSQQKIFSLEEVARMVPLLSNSFREIFRMNDQIRKLRVGVEDLLAIWGDEVREGGHVDFEMYSERMEKMNKMQQKVQRLLSNIQGTGALIKDVNVGMVDFHARHGDEIIMLCWKFGEKEIGFWHPLSSEPVKRKPISELKE